MVKMLKQGDVCTECWAWGSVFGLLGVGRFCTGVLGVGRFVRSVGRGAVFLAYWAWVGFVLVTDASVV